MSANKKQILKAPYDARVDNYIDSASEFAQPILRHLREVVHDLCPEAHEDIKWSFPHFVYRDRPLCHMAAFKEHCSFGFWQAALMEEADVRLAENAKLGMGHFGKIRTLRDLPKRAEMKRYVQSAMRLNEEGVRLPRAARGSVDKLELPIELKAALGADPDDMRCFELLTPSHKREYIDWIASAKKEDTRKRRVERTIANIREGKSQHWKYQSSPSHETKKRKITKG